MLLDDRIAEHVPGCNMAFRRDALLAIDGFNPIYLRAGDDVDVCWRLQARGWKIGFASSALVWHHHRSSVKAYWRQQVGYGEGETWLMAHHPEKFLDGRMLWRGRIYSPLPFVRSLWGTRINAGVWGTAAFPSVYRTDVHPFAFLPHSIKWQVISFVLTIAGIGVAAMGQHHWTSYILLGSGIVGLATTVAKNIAYALRSDVDSLPGSRLWYRATVAYLHFIQPLARLRGRIRGVLSPPTVAVPPSEPQTSRGPRPSLAEAWRALLLISGNVTEDRFWSETWTSADRVLTAAHRLAAALARGPHDRDRRRAGPTIATSACSSAAGPGSTSARSSRSTAAARRCCASARTCGRRASASSAPSSASAPRCWSRPAVAGVALRWPLAGAIAGSSWRWRSSPSPPGAPRRRRRSCGAAIGRVALVRGWWRCRRVRRGCR